MRRLLFLAPLAALGACGSGGPTTVAQPYGPNPTLPEPVQSLLPDVHIPEVIGWKPGEAPTVPKGFTISPVSQQLSNPRRVIALENGDLLVLNSKRTTSEPMERPKDLIASIMFAKAHGDDKGPKRPSNQLVLLRDTNGDGRADIERVLIDKLNMPFGIEYRDGQLYIAATDALLAFPYAPGSMTVGTPRKIVDLPEGPYNHHWTKDLAVSPDGSKVYVGIGSNSNIVERGIEAETNRAAIWEVDAKTGAFRIFASGLRNPNGLVFYPGTQTLWAVINERDELGPNLVPDYMTSVKDGAFYGWPYSYFGNQVDHRVRPQRPDLVAKAISPDYSLSSHVAPLGLAFYTGSSFPAGFRGGAIVGEHGSWNRQGLHGYKVVFVRFAGGKPVGDPKTLVAGFIKDGKARGRPVGVAIDRDGSVLIADDVGNSVWRVSYSGSASPAGA